MDSKKCRKCGEEKPLSEFYNDKRVKKDGKQAQCKKCVDIKKREYRQTHKEQRSAYERLQNETNEEWREKAAIRNKRYYEKLKEENGERFIQYKETNKKNLEILRKRHPNYFMWAGARVRAHKNNIPFDIELEDIVVTKYCPILEIEMIRNEECADYNSLSLDRIIPSLGYVKGNVRVISRLANTMKQNATPELLNNFAKNIMKYINNEDIVRTIENVESIELEDKELLG